jgi:AcrR family transcriptional regulator
MPSQTGRGQPAGPIWLRPEPGSRRPRYTRQQIAQTALAIADTEGIQAVTMRRIAAELGAGTMTLYHYVGSKNDLIALMEDAIMGELLVPDGQLPTDWRQALTAIARRARATFRRHPWALTGMRGTGLSPHALRHFEQSLAAVADTGLDAAARLDLIALVDDYVAGFVLKSDLEPALEAIPPDIARAAADHLDAQLATGHYPHTQALLGTGDRLAALARLAAASINDQRFERGLARLLGGVALDLPRRRTKDTSDRARQHRT